MKRKPSVWIVPGVAMGVFGGSYIPSSYISLTLIILMIFVVYLDIRIALGGKIWKWF